MGGRCTRRAVSSSLRWGVLLGAKAITSERCGRRAEGMKSRRPGGGGEGEPNDNRRMVAENRGSARSSRAQSLWAQ